MMMPIIVMLLIASAHDALSPPDICRNRQLIQLF